LKSAKFKTELQKNVDLTEILSQPILTQPDSTVYDILLTIL